MKEKTRTYNLEAESVPVLRWQPAAKIEAKPKAKPGQRRSRPSVFLSQELIFNLIERIKTL